MGFIKAFSGAVGATLGDQWLDYYQPMDNVPGTAAVFYAVQKGTDNGRGSNTSGSESVISNGSKIVVPEGTALITMQEGAITGLICEPGGYTFRSDDVNTSSIFAGDGFVTPLIKSTWEKFKFGGQTSSQQSAIYVNLKEIPNNKFGTQSEIYWDDAFLNTQAGAMTRGTYTLKILDPLLFVKNFVPSSYLSSGKVFDLADMNNDAASQLFNEVVGSLSAAFAGFTNSVPGGNRIGNIQKDSIGFAKSLSAAVEENYLWKNDRGLEIVKVAIQAIEYDEVTKQIMQEAQKVDSLSGARGNAFMQQSVARGLEAAGQNGGGASMAFMGMGANAAGGMMQGLQQPVQQGYQQPMQQGYQQPMGQPVQQGYQQPIEQPMGQPVVGQPMEAAGQPVMQSTESAPAEDPYAKLAELKKLADAGVISQADFDAAKNKLLGI